MKPFPAVILRKGKEEALKRFHPWIFSGAIYKIEGNPGEGEIVEIFSAEKEYLATGHYQRGSIAIKLFSFRRTPADRDFWKSKLENALLLRKQIGLADDPMTNAFRLVNSEGDGMPGLIIDWYNGVAVMSAQGPGMQKLSELFADILRDMFGEKLIAVYDKESGKFLAGNSEPVVIRESGHTFRVDFIRGQKTGFFLDQRNSRILTQSYARGRKVLNLFCYSGAFSVYALKGGAALVHSVDSSRQAIGWTKGNILLNGIDASLNRSFVADVMNYFPGIKEKYDLIILDPPAFAKTHTVTHNALMAYIHINAEALRILNPGGLLFTFSCSQAISPDMFRSAVLSAALESGCEVKVLHRLSQGPDHPVSIYHPEGEYLKGLVVEKT